MTRRLKLRFRYNGVIAGVAPVFTAAPVVIASGVGSPVVWLTGTATGTPAPTHTFVVLLNGVSQGANYTPVTADLGKTITVQDTATNASGSAVSTSAGLVVTTFPAETALWTTPLGAQADAGQNDDTATLIGGASRYFCDSVSGLDTYNGLSRYPGKLDDGVTVNAAYGPVKTLAQVNTILSGAAAGAYVLFNRAQSFVGSILIQLSWAGNFTLGAYGTGARPLFDYDGSSRVWATCLWTNGQTLKMRNLHLNGNYLPGTCTLTLAAPGVVTQTAHGRKVGQAVQFRTTGALPTGLAAGTFYWVSTVVDANNYNVAATQGGAAIAFSGTQSGTQTVSGPEDIGIGLNASATNCQVVNCYIEGFGDSGFAGTNPSLYDSTLVQNTTIYNNVKRVGAPGGGVSGNFSNSKILGCTIDSNGASTLLAHNTYFGGNHILVQGCVVSNGSNLGVVVHGNDSFLTFADNYFHDNNNGINIGSAQYPNTVESLTDIIIERNTFFNHGYVGGQGVAMIFDTVRRLYVRNNKVYGNKLGCISLSDFAGTGPDAIDDLPSQDVYIYNNTFEYTEPATGNVIAYQGASFVNLNIRDNILRRTYTSGFLTSRNATFPVGQVTLDYNLYDAPNVTGGLFIDWAGTSYTLAGFKTAVPTQEVHGVSGASLFNTGTNVYTLQAGSPAKSAGGSIPFVTLDFAGTTRSATTPSIGAYE